METIIGVSDQPNPINGFNFLAKWKVPFKIKFNYNGYYVGIRPNSRSPWFGSDDYNGNSWHFTAAKAKTVHNGFYLFMSGVDPAQIKGVYYFDDYANLIRMDGGTEKYEGYWDINPSNDVEIITHWMKAIGTLSGPLESYYPRSNIFYPQIVSQDSFWLKNFEGRFIMGDNYHQWFWADNNLNKLINKTDAGRDMHFVLDSTWLYNFQVRLAKESRSGPNKLKEFIEDALKVQKVFWIFNRQTNQGQKLSDEFYRYINWKDKWIVIPDYRKNCTQANGCYEDLREACMIDRYLPKFEQNPKGGFITTNFDKKNNYAVLRQDGTLLIKQGTNNALEMCGNMWNDKDERVRNARLQEIRHYYGGILSSLDSADRRKVEEIMLTDRACLPSSMRGLNRTSCNIDIKVCNNVVKQKLINSGVGTQVINQICKFRQGFKRSGTQRKILINRSTGYGIGY